MGREDEAAYEIYFQLRLKAPKAVQTVEEFSELNPELAKVLPDFPELLEGSKVSGFFYLLYENKSERVQTYLTRLDRVLSRHNFYDCDAILELTHPETGQKALLIQSDMDVVSDGTDGDRRPDLNEYISNSDNFQPWTSYGWAKRTKQPNPLLPRWEKKLKEYEEEFKIKGLSVERNRFLRSEIDRLKREVADLRARSFLIGEADPFIVVPSFMFRYRGKEPFAPGVGDYAVVIHEDRVYPAIVGDAGPTYKAGEASLRMAKEVNENAGVYNRPVSDLGATYLVFPGSAEPTKGPPDLAKWRERCGELLDGMGGLGEGYAMHEWDDWFNEKVEPAADSEVETEAGDAGGGPESAVGEAGP